MYFTQQSCIHFLQKKQHFLVLFKIEAVEISGWRHDIYLQEDDWPSFVASVHQVPDVTESGHSQFRQVLHIGTQDGMLPDPQSPLGLWVQQIPDPLTVDLHVGHLRVEETAFSQSTFTEWTSLNERIRASLPPQSRSGQDQSFLLFSGTSPHTAEHRDRGSIIRFGPYSDKKTL